MSEGYEYRGTARAILKEGAHVGDVVKITRRDETFEGALMPRYELADDEHIVIKLRNGYNIGIKLSPDLKIEKIGLGAKPTFASQTYIGKKEELPTIVIISTGGTIASRVDYRTGAVRPALTTNDLLTVVPRLAEIANLQTEVIFTLLSENIYALHWTEIVKTVAKYINQNVEGVVICHGTDTLAYTSAALSFALQNLPVPVILVGSQRSSDRPSSDAAFNLVNAVQAAAHAPIAEVMVGMHETISDDAMVLHRGTKVRKLHTSRRDAFRSVNSSPLARIQREEITLLTADYQKKDQKRRLVVKPFFNQKAALVKFYPGLDPQVIEWYVQEGYRGLIFEGTGLGHLSRDCFSSVQKAIDSGMFLGMCSQCVHGRVNMKVYDTGRYLYRIGVTPLEDMLPETAFVKLSWILAQTTDLNEVKKVMETNLVGEIDSRSIYD